MDSSLNTHNIKPGSMVGKIYDYDNHTEKSDLPELKGYLFQSASIVELTKNFENYGMTMFAKGDTNLLLFDSVVRNENDRVMGYKIIDTLFFSKVTDSDLVAYAQCTIDTIDAPEVIGLFRYKKQVIPKPLKAWKIDVSSKRIIPMDTAHVRVYIEDDGEGD
jgi:hypothetical protein